MNLYDLVRRKDRALEISGEVQACEVRHGDMMRAVRFAPRSMLRVRSAHEAHCFQDFPTDPGWRATGEESWSITVESESAGGTATLASAEGNGGSEAALKLRWPVPVPSQFDLVVRGGGARELLLLVGPLFDSRAALLPLLRGRGVEVGPGLNPILKPQPGVDVSYVEKMHPRDWAATYAKRELTAAEMALWDHYVVDSARYLSGFAAGSLDFIFSNHVFEHLVDPIGTLVRWWDRLAPGGVLAGVVPDMRFTFDWRHPAWTITDIRAQRGLQEDAPTQAMYERWCRYTAPGATPESLRARDYSIHVNYYTPSVMRQVLDDVVEELKASARPQPDGVFLQSNVNGRDFSFLLRKSGSPT